MGDRRSSRLPASLAFLTRSSRAARALAIRCSRASSLSVSLSSEELPHHKNARQSTQADFRRWNEQMSAQGQPYQSWSSHDKL